MNLGFVSAYILSRGGEAVIVDTGIGGSADAIEQSLTAVGLDWAAVGHMILTHHHGDHAGSAADVLDRASDAVGYAGAEDVTSITVPRPLTVVADGDDVFGLTIVTTPGHTPGKHLGLRPGRRPRSSPATPSARRWQADPPGDQFTEDMDLAKQSIVKLGGLTFETLLVGHGDPIESGASTAVAALGAAG